jgi:hypothetical protein
LQEAAGVVVVKVFLAIMLAAAGRVVYYRG